MENKHQKINSSQVCLTGSSQVHLTGHLLQDSHTCQSSQVHLTGFAEKQSSQLDTINTIDRVYSDTERLGKNDLREPFMSAQSNEEQHKH